MQTSTKRALLVVAAVAVLGPAVGGVVGCELLVQLDPALVDAGDQDGLAVEEETVDGPVAPDGSMQEAGTDSSDAAPDTSMESGGDTSPSDSSDSATETSSTESGTESGTDSGTD